MLADVFNSDNFNVYSLTSAIDKLPYVPKRIGQMGLFKEEGVPTDKVGIEWREGKIHLIQTRARGSRPQGRSTERRKVLTFSIPHIPHDDVVMADEVLGVREFGSDDQLESSTAVVNKKLQKLKQDHEVTWEYHRIKALHGVILDADGTELLDLYDAFDVTPVEFEFDFSAVDSQQLKRDIMDLFRAMESALGNDTFTGIHAMCGNDFFDNLITADEVRVSYDRWKDGEFFRNIDGVRKIGGGGGFMWNDIFWENYRGQVGTTKFVEDDKCRFFPTGTADTFKRYNAPADFMEAVNTNGKALYAKQKMMDFEKGVDIHTQSNPLFMVERPAVLIEGTDVTPIES